ELPRADHLCLDHRAQAIDLLQRTLEQQFVVDLQDQPRAESGGGSMTADHRDLDDVGGGALDHRVDGQTLAERVLLAVARAQLGDLAAAAEQRRDVALLDGLRDRPLDELADRWKPLEVSRDEHGRLLARYLQ